MIARSIHPIPAPPVEESDQCSVDSIQSAKRTRRVTNDPAREYAQRPGEVEPLPNQVAALILCKKGWAKIERHQIKLTLDGEELVFASRDSIIITAKNGTGERVLWAVNRRAPDLLHLLTNDGAYIETIPRKGVATWFSSDEESQKAYADAQAQIQRDARRLRDLHAEDTELAARDAQENAATTTRLVNTFPAAEAEHPTPNAQHPTSNARSGFSKGDRLAEVLEQSDRRREDLGKTARQAAREQDAAVRLGEMVRASVFAPAAATIPEEEEDFPTTQTHQPIIEESC